MPCARAAGLTATTSILPCTNRRTTKAVPASEGSLIANQSVTRYGNHIATKRFDIQTSSNKILLLTSYLTQSPITPSSSAPLPLLAHQPVGKHPLPIPAASCPGVRYG